MAALAGTTLLVASAAPAQADGYQPLEDIRGAVKEFLVEQTAGQRVTPRIEVGRLDPRLRLARCPRPLETALAPGSSPSGNTTVQVRCSGPKPWALYVQAAVRTIQRVLVAARPLVRGTMVERNDLEFDERDVSRLTSGYYTDLKNVLGMRVKRSIGSGMPLNRYALERRKLVRRGDRVTIIANSGGLEVRMSGKAMSDGSEGDTIRVKNTSSKREIEAVVAAPGIVEVRM